jgi:hypothetical protein
VGRVVRLHDGLRALYPDAVVFAAVGTGDTVRGIDRLRALRGLGTVVRRTPALSVAVSAEGVVIWGESPLLTLRLSELAAIGVDEGAMDVTALVSGTSVRLLIPLAVPAESAHIADRVIVALAGQRSA